MRHKAGGRNKGGAANRPVMSSAGIRAGANTVFVDPPNTIAGVGVGAAGSGIRRPDEAEAYYNNPYVRNSETNSTKINSTGNHLTKKPSVTYSTKPNQLN